MDTQLLEHIEDELAGVWADLAGTANGITHLVITNETGGGTGNNAYC